MFSHATLFHFSYASPQELFPIFSDGTTFLCVGLFHVNFASYISSVLCLSPSCSNIHACIFDYFVHRLPENSSTTLVAPKLMIPPLSPVGQPRVLFPSEAKAPVKIECSFLNKNSQHKFRKYSRNKKRSTIFLGRFFNCS